MYPKEFLDVSGYFYKGFQIISKIMLSMYLEAEISEKIEKEISNFKKVVTVSSCLSKKDRRLEKKGVLKEPKQKLSGTSAFIRKEMYRYKKKYYYLSSNDIFKIMIRDFKIAKKMKKLEEDYLNQTPTQSNEGGGEHSSE